MAINSPQTLKFDLSATKDGWCVSFVKKNGFSHLSGNANVWIGYIDSFTPVNGAAVVMSYGNIGHLGLYIDGYIWHQNFEGRWVVSQTPFEDVKSHIIGYITP